MRRTTTLAALALLPLALSGCGDWFGAGRTAQAPSQSARCDAAVQTMAQAQPTAVAGREQAAPDTTMAFNACMQSAGWQPVQGQPTPTVTQMVVTAGPAARASRRSLGLEVMLMGLTFPAPGYARGAPGLLVMEVMPGGAAQAAGLRRGDILLSFGGTPVGAPQATQAALAKVAPGSRIAVELWRDQGPMVASLTF